MIYKFGVMSNLWSLEADSDNIAYISMVIYIGKDVPIAIYSNETELIFPKEILLKYKDNFDENKVKQCIQTITKLLEVTK